MEAVVLLACGRERPDMRAGWLMLRAVLFALITVRVIVGPLAEVSPPDPAWIAGVYDGGDFDDIADQLASLAGICDRAGGPPRFRLACAGVAPLDVHPATRTGRITPHDRAPPSP